MASVWTELKRRKVVKVAVAYGIVGWLLIEVASVLLPTFQAPEWIMRVFSFFIIAGFPVALVLSWASELTPEGVKKTEDVIEDREGLRQLVGQNRPVLSLQLGREFVVDRGMVERVGFRHAVERGEDLGMVPVRDTPWLDQSGPAQLQAAD